MLAFFKSNGLDRYKVCNNKEYVNLVKLLSVLKTYYFKTLFKGLFTRYV